MPVDDIPIKSSSDGATYLVATKRDADGIDHELDIIEFLDIDGEPIGVSAAAPLPILVTGTVASDIAGTRADADAMAASLATLAGTVTGGHILAALAAALPAGTNNIGLVDINAQPAAAPATDGIVTYAGSDKTYFDNGSGFTSLTYKTAGISRATNADGAAVVSLVSSKKIRVLAFWLVAAASVGFKWQSSTSNSSGSGSNTDIPAGTGYATVAATGGLAVAAPGYFLFETAAGEALKLNLNGAQQTSGGVVYVER